MKYLDEFRELESAQLLAERIKAAVTRPWKIMEVCGGQTHTILQYGLESLLPDTIELLHGPGCPVCVTPLELIDKAIAIANTADVTFCSFGDMLRVPGSTIDLLGARAAGADVRVVYSPLDALNIAIQNPDRRIVFFAVGFETTAPANAMAAYQAKLQNISNFFMLCSHVTVPPVMSAILESPDNLIDAFIGPGHVCCVTGCTEYAALSEQFKVPIVISGFEPVDILAAILHCVVQLESGEAKMENHYARAVGATGNLRAQEVLADVFEVADRVWRGLGPIPKSGFKLSAKYSQFDAENEFSVESIEVIESPLCISAQILKGLKKPFDCSAFGNLCTPENPLGATMVSTEGTCANYFKFGRMEKCGSGVKDLV